MKKSVLKALFIIAVVLVLCCSVLVFTNRSKKFRDIVNYNGKTYELLEYNMDIFTYYFKCNDYFEEDAIHPVSNEKWDAVYFNGDVFVEESKVKDAIKLYSHDKNYNWFVTFDKEDSQIKIPLSVTEKELKSLYNMEDFREKETMTFDDIKQFASIVKESKDGFVYALITLAQCYDSWYWKTEIMNDNDEEYIVPVPETLSEKLFDLAE